MKHVTIRNFTDFLALQGMSNVVAQFAVGIIDLTEIAVIRNLYGVTLDGRSAPKGRVAIAGAPVQFIDAVGLDINHVAFHCGTPPNQAIEKSWGLRFLSSKPSGTHHVTLRNCSIRGNFDETAIRRDDFLSVLELAAHHFTLDACVVGPSCVSKRPDRLAHNFGAAFSRCDYVTVRNCLIAEHNRRLVQLQGEHGLITGNVLAGFGTMCCGLHSGTSVDIRHNVFLPSALSPARIKPVMPVVGTVASAYGPLGGVKLRLDDWSLWGSGVESLTIDKLWHGEPIITMPPIFNNVLTQAGVQDTVDRDMANRVRQSKCRWHETVPLNRADYE